MENKEQNNKGLEIEHPIITEIEHTTQHPDISEKETKQAASR